MNPFILLKNFDWLAEIEYLEIEVTILKIDKISLNVWSVIFTIIDWF